MCFGKEFHLILMNFYFLSSMLWGVFTKIRLFFKKVVFPDFRLIHSVFQSIEIFSKNFGEPLSSSIDQNCFSINRISWIRFFKTWILTFSKELFQKFFKFSLSLRFRLGSTSDFCRFWYFLLQGFSLQTPVRPFYPSFCFYFHFSCILIWEFRTMHKLGFLMIQAKFCVIDHWVLLLYCYIHDLC